MSINRNGFIVSICLLVCWLLCFIILGNNYKAVELELMAVYIVVLFSIMRVGGFYGETTLFLFTFGLFLCSYPFMDLLGIGDFDVRRNNIFSFYTIPDVNIVEALNALILTLIIILLAYSIFNKSSRITNYEIREDEGNKLPGYFNIFFVVLFILVIVYRIAEITIYQVAGSYLSLFSENTTSSPLDRFDIIVHLFEVMLYIALAYKPEKKIVKRYIILYILSVIPQFAMGRRGPVLISLLFVVWYYCNYVRRIKIRYIVLPTLGLVFVANAVANIRNNQAIELTSTFLRDFLEQQGVSFDVVANASFHFDDLMSSNTIHVPYFLGMVHKYFVYIFNRLTFTDSVFGHGQSMDALNNSSYLGWKLTYLIAPYQYSIGRGTGSSFVAENFLFFKYFGCIVLTILMLWLVYWLKNKFEQEQNIYIRVVFFIVIQSLFYSPRNNFWIFISDVIVALVVLFMLNVLMPRVFKDSSKIRLGS